MPGGNRRKPLGERESQAFRRFESGYLSVRVGLQDRGHLSLRAFDTAGMMLDSDIIDGKEIEGFIERLFANPQVDTIHAHYARRGCCSGRIERA